MTRLTKNEQNSAINALTTNNIDFVNVVFGQSQNAPKVTVEVEVDPTGDILAHSYDTLAPLQTKIWKVLGGAVDVIVIKRDGNHIAIFTAYEVQPKYFATEDIETKQRSNVRHVAKIAIKKVKSVVGLVVAKVIEPVIEAVKIVKSRKVEKAERLAKIKAMVMVVAWLASLIETPRPTKVSRFFNVKGENNGRSNQADCSIGIF